MRFRQRLILLAALILTLVSGATAAAEGLRLGLMETADTTPIEVRVDGQLFVIPHNYFRHPPSRDGADDGFLLRVLLPDLEPYTVENSNEFNRGGFGRKMNILLEAKGRIRPLEELLDLYQEGVPPTAPSDATFGLAYGSHKFYGDVFAFSRSGAVDSLLTCDRYQTGLDAHCKHLFVWSDYTVQLRCGRDFLPQWRTIQEYVTALLEQLHKPTQGNKE